MANHRRMRRIFRTRIQQRFQPSRRPLKEQRSNRCILSNHVHQITMKSEVRSERRRRWLALNFCIRLLTSAFCILTSNFTIPSPRSVSDILVTAWTLSRSLANLSTSNPSPATESAVGNYLYGELCRIGYQALKIPVEGDRFNVYATSPEQPHPELVFSTHMDTVPPFTPSTEDAARIYGRGSCDAKGIIAAQIAASERLCGKEFMSDCSSWWERSATAWGARIANEYAAKDQAHRRKYLVNGEPTENRIALASKGTLRAEVTASGRMAHSAYPELGESAIDKLITALTRLRAMPLPSDAQFGPCTLNIGLIEGGPRPQRDSRSRPRRLLYRLVGPSQDLRRQILETAGNEVKVDFPLEIPFLRLRTVEGLPTMIAAFTTDIPALTNWGAPLLIGPGSIHVAHTDGEFIRQAATGGSD